MANYTVTDYVSTEDSIEQCAAALETKLETLDSTNNPIRLIKIIRLPNNKFQATLMYD